MARPRAVADAVRATFAVTVILLLLLDGVTGVDRGRSENSLVEREVSLDRYVTSTVAAQRRVYRLEPRPLSDLADWATRQSRYWNLKLDALEQHLLDHPPKERS